MRKTLKGTTWSGIYAGKYHKDIFKLVEQIPRLEKDVFLFSIAGSPEEKYEQPMKELLTSKGARIVGEFRCLGQAGFFGFIWANKGHPDEQDLERARAFAKGLVSGWVYQGSAVIISSISRSPATARLPARHGQ